MFLDFNTIYKWFINEFIYRGHPGAIRFPIHQPH